MSGKKKNQKRKLFVHIGMHKTGTTSIQYVLHESARNLRKAGFLYPTTGRHPLAHVQHDLLFLALRGNHGDGNLFKVDDVPEAEEIFARLKSEIFEAKVRNTIVSAENLSLLDSSEVQRFASYFDDFEIVPILFTRRLSEYVESIHLTRIRIDTEYARMFRDRQSFWRSYLDINLLSWIRAWAKVSSTGKVVLRNYDSQETDSVACFCKAVGIDPQILSKKVRRLNQSQTVLSEAIRTACGRHGLSEDLAKRLAAQISKVKFSERFSLIPADGRETLDTAYFSQITEALELGLVETDDTFEFAQSGSQLVHVDGALSILFAVGRAVANDDRLQ